MVQSPGSNPPSGSGEPPKPKAKRASPGWRAVSEKLQLEVEKLQEENKKLTESLKTADQKLERIKAAGWDERHNVKLRAFEHFYSRVLNAQTKCKEDKAYLDELVKDVQYIIKDKFTKLGM